MFYYFNYISKYFSKKFSELNRKLRLLRHIQMSEKKKKKKIKSNNEFKFWHN